MSTYFTEECVSADSICEFSIKEILCTFHVLDMLLGIEDIVVNESSYPHGVSFLLG